MKFIELHGERLYLVNPDSIVVIKASNSEPPMKGEVALFNGNYLFVLESPEEILELIEENKSKID